VAAHARTAFAALFLAGQAALIATAGLRADHSYAFRMFEESSTVRVRVFRVLDDGGLLPVENEAWEARDCAGAPHRFAWGDYVRWPAPSRLDTTVLAPYGVAAALAEARGAVEWIAAHTRDDCQTLAWRAEVTTRRNGARAETVTFTVERRR